MVSEILTVPELAERMRVTSRTIYNWRRAKLVKALKRIGKGPILFDWDDVLKGLKDNRGARVRVF